MQTDAAAQGKKRNRSSNPQPLAAINLPGGLVRLETLAQASGLSVATLYRKAKAGELVLTKIGKRCTRVRSDAAREFLQSLGA